MDIIEKFNQDVVDTVNQSNLPLSVIKIVLQKTLQEIEIVNLQTQVAKLQEELQKANIDKDKEEI